MVQAQSSVLAQVDFPVAGGAGIGDAGLLGLVGVMKRKVLAGSGRSVVAR